MASPKKPQKSAKAKPAAPKKPSGAAPKKPASSAKPAKSSGKSSASSARSSKPGGKAAADPSGGSVAHAPPPVEASAPLPVPLSLNPTRVLALQFVRDGDEFMARLETAAGQITELKNRSLDQLLTMVAGELEDLLG